MILSFIGIWIEIRWLKKEMSAAVVMQSNMETNLTKTAAIVCGTYLLLSFPFLLLVNVHPQPPNEDLPGMFYLC